MNNRLIKKFFPIPTQTSLEDKLVILSINRFLSRKKFFEYLEIGSYLGGSLTPFLMNKKCKKVMSIDHRNQILDDERSEKFSYEKVSENMMIENLKNQKIDITRLRTYNGDIKNFKGFGKYDLVFIDGIHTDKNTFSDFLYSFDKLKKNSIIIFHDSVVIYKALVLINEFLKKNNHTFKIIKFKNSGITGVFLGSISKINISAKIYPTENFNEFIKNAEKSLLIQQLTNRVDIKFKISRFLKNKFPYKFIIKSKKQTIV